MMKPKGNIIKFVCQISMKTANVWLYSSTLNIRQSKVTKRKILHNLLKSDGIRELKILSEKNSNREITAAWRRGNALSSYVRGKVPQGAQRSVDRNHSLQ